jgi:hypothetical protein
VPLEAEGFEPPAGVTNGPVRVLGSRQDGRAVHERSCVVLCEARLLPRTAGSPTRRSSWPVARIGPEGTDHPVLPRSVPIEES